MSVLANANAMGAGGVDTGDIGHSLRFRGDSVNCNLTRTPTAGNLRKWTISGWVKRSALTANFPSLFSATLNASFNDSFYFDNTDALVWSYSNTGTALASSAKYRDPTAFLHVVAVWDTDNATASNRARIYVNGVELTSFTTDNRASIANRNSTWNQAVVNYVGGSSNSALAMRGYMARFCFVEGQALTPASFGYQNTEINEWVSKSQSAVKAVVDAGGTNSFMLDFDDGTSLTTLGYDKSSKGNNWTLNNFSLTAGTSYDWMLDVPGNSFATLNPLQAGLAPINGNLALLGAGAHRNVFATQYFGAQVPIYFEGYPSAIQRFSFGIATKDLALTSAATGQTAFRGMYGDSTALEVKNGASSLFSLSAVAATDVFQIAINPSTGNAWFGRNDTYYSAVGATTGNPATGANPTFTGLTASDFAAILGTYDATNSNINFGQAPLHASATYDAASGGYFRYTPPSGYKALCQRNMPDPAILNPELHMDVVTYTGTAATKSITGLGFQPDLVEMKSRGRALDWAYYDSVRGVEKRLESNNTDAEVTGDTTGLTAFNSDGWTMGALDQINGTTATNSFVGFAWKAGGAPVTNNAGSISSQVSANVTAGFSIVTYTGTGANATVGHGLGKAPGFFMVKQRAGGVENWYGQHTGLTGGTYYLMLNSASAQVNDSTRFTAFPTSSVLNLGSNSAANGNTATYVAYCFAEIPGFSKIFSYTGNGSTDGPYVECGFKPKYVLVKRTDVAATWCVLDGERNKYNVANLDLYPNLSIAESGVDFEADFASNSFKLRTTDAESNASGGTYIGIAFADVAGKYSLGR